MSNFSLAPKNVRFVLIGLIVMVAGYILMAGGGSSDPDVFNPEIFNFRRLVISPLLVIIGIGIVIVAIMKKPRKGKDDKSGQ